MYPAGIMNNIHTAVAIYLRSAIEKTFFAFVLFWQPQYFAVAYLLSFFGGKNL